MNDVPPEVKAVSVDAVVRRLHMNVGNPTQREFFKEPSQNI